MTRSTRQTAWCAVTLEQRLSVVGSRASAQSGRNGFTLVELLVVVGIIAVLAAIITPAIFQARISAQNAAIRAEIDLLHMGMMNYKNQFGGYPPCFSDCSKQAAGGDRIARNHLQRLFPRCNADESVNPLNPRDQFYVYLDGNGQDDNGDDIPDNNESFYNYLTPLDSPLFWLGGYASNPAFPLQGGGKREKLYDEDASRVDPDTNAYYPAGKPNAPFIYIHADQYDVNANYRNIDGYDLTPRTFSTYDKQNLEQIPGGPYDAEINPNGGYYNPDKFQILNAGLDEQWGTDDDLSNFWKGTRGDQE